MCQVHACTSCPWAQHDASWISNRSCPRNDVLCVSVRTWPSTRYKHRHREPRRSAESSDWPSLPPPPFPTAGPPVNPLGCAADGRDALCLCRFPLCNASAPQGEIMVFMVNGHHACHSAVIKPLGRPAQRVRPAKHVTLANRPDLASGDASRQIKKLSLALISDRRDPRRNSHASAIK